MAIKVALGTQLVLAGRLLAADGHFLFQRLVGAGRLVPLGQAMLPVRLTQVTGRRIAAGIDLHPRRFEPDALDAQLIEQGAVMADNHPYPAEPLQGVDQQAPRPASR